MFQIVKQKQQRCEYLANTIQKQSTKLNKII